MPHSDARLLAACMGRHALQVSVPDIAFELSRPALGHKTLLWEAMHAVWTCKP